MNGSRRFFVAAVVLLGCTAASDTSADPPVPKAPGRDTPVQQASATAAGKAPDQFRVKFETTKGDFVIEVHRDWAPNGADHFHELIEAKFYDGCKFFRVVPGFMVQFGINGDVPLNKEWKDKTIRDEGVKKSNKKGFVTYAKSGLPNSRSTQIFINYGDNSFLDKDGFSPFGQIVEGMDVVEKINAEYGERPDQGRMHSEGDAYLSKAFPRLDGIKTARVLPAKAE